MSKTELKDLPAEYVMILMVRIRATTTAQSNRDDDAKDE